MALKIREVHLFMIYIARWASFFLLLLVAVDIPFLFIENIALTKEVRVALLAAVLVFVCAAEWILSMILNGQRIAKIKNFSSGLHGLTLNQVSREAPNEFTTSNEFTVNGLRETVQVWKAQGSHEMGRANDLYVQLHYQWSNVRTESKLDIKDFKLQMRRSVFETKVVSIKQEQDKVTFIFQFFPIRLNKDVFNLIQNSENSLAMPIAVQGLRNEMEIFLNRNRISI